jgi:hypothetical protein
METMIAGRTYGVKLVDGLRVEDEAGEFLVDHRDAVIEGVDHGGGRGELFALGVRAGIAACREAAPAALGMLNPFAGDIGPLSRDEWKCGIPVLPNDPTTDE